MPLTLRWKTASNIHKETSSLFYSVPCSLLRVPYSLFPIPCSLLRVPYSLLIILLVSFVAKLIKYSYTVL
ncbi:hypothetical protein DP116_23640 [Brasilonema bromeliae SPC951]|uniref:Uncharacterized protein n=1 Tax=Brasilonema bromeliae SPC951 TaxID=385972 RepID=A0ABX1PD54_9CYAN|nr:hypothetical protein [Brasilonema bromeliae SPC951]